MTEKNLEVRIVFGSSSNQTGAIDVVDDSGTVMWGPVPVCGRADHRSASANNNSDRNPTKLYGDTPAGSFTVTALIQPEDLDLYDVHAYGLHGVIVLEPLSGEAVEAKANGRRQFLIHAGEASSTGMLCATNGSLRLRNADLQQLMNLVETGCVIKVSRNSTVSIPQTLVDVESPFDYDDPCALEFRGIRDVTTPRVNRGRVALAGSAVVFASSVPQSDGSSTGYGATASRQCLSFDTRGGDPNGTSYGAGLSFPPSVQAASYRTASSTLFTSTRMGAAARWPQTVYGARIL